MDKNLKRSIFIVTIILSLAIIAVPVYFFVLADESDNNGFTVVNSSIKTIEDGSGSFDANDLDGNDSSISNNRVRTFDDISYTVEYTLTEKQAGTTSGNVEGRTLLVEVLVPTSYEVVLRHDEESIYMNEGNQNIIKVTIGGVEYYYGSFNASVAALGTPSTFGFALNNVYTNDIINAHKIEPLVFIKESTDRDTQSVVDDTTRSSISCGLTDCGVEITGVENYFVNMYVGNRSQDSNIVPIGLILGLRSSGEKGIKGLLVPKSLSFTITNSDTTTLTFNDGSIRDYDRAQSSTSYKIDIDENNREMPELDNGTITGTISDNTLTVSLTDIKSYLIDNQTHYFSTNYFLTTISEREDHDYRNRTADLTSSVNNSLNGTSVVQVLDPYDYIVGNYSSKIDIYESSLTSESEGDPLPYGKANINYGADFTVKTSFDYSSLSNAGGAGLTSLTNYIKIDNDVFELINDKKTNQSYNFSTGEVITTPKIKIATEIVDGNTQNMVLFGFGEWNGNYFEIAQNAPSGCPSSVSSLTKEQLMNLYGGPCIVAKNTVQWAYSPVSQNDIDGNEITSTKGPLIVKSTYDSFNTNYIDTGTTGIFELYGTIVEDSAIANSSHQIVTCATAYGRDNTDLRYLGNESNNGDALLANPNNFYKTNYDFNNRNVISLNSNVCGNDKCPATGATILISGIKSVSPTLSAYKATNLDTPASEFYYYPLALKVIAGASKNDENLRFDTIYVDIYMPSYMEIVPYGTSEKQYTVEGTTLANVRSRFGKEAPETDMGYKVYHYVLTTESQGLSESDINDLQRGLLSNFVVYADIDLIATPNASRPEIYTSVDFKAVKHIITTDGIQTTEYRPISPETDRYASLDNLTLYNLSAVTTKSSLSPSNIEKGGTYTFNMIAYNHSNSIIQGGYVYPTADLYYVLPYNGDLATTETSSKIGTTKYKVSFTQETINNLSNPSDYKFYYATEGVPSNILSDEIKTTSDVSAIWQVWNDPTTPVSDVIAVKVVKRSAFTPNTYFGSEQGLTINVETVGSSDGNVFYNSFHILATKPDNFTCETAEGDTDEYCVEARQTKANYASSSSKTSVYERIISGFVFEDYDYNGIYTENESRLKDIPVSLYKVDTIPENYDPIDPTTFVNETDTLVGTTVTGENGNYYFGGLATGNYYVSYTIDNAKYIVTDLKRIDENIIDSQNNNSYGSLLPKTNKAITEIITFEENTTEGLIKSNINLGLAIKKEMAISLNKYITQVDVTRNGYTDTYDYSNQNATQVSINVLNPKGTTVRVKYSFVIENTKYFPGYVGLIVDNIPDGMTFNPNIKENQNWVMYDNLLYYNGLAGKLLLPNEKQYFTLILDMELKQGGTYRNVVSARDITLMGDQLPVYDFSGLINTNTNTNNTEGGE